MRLPDVWLILVFLFAVVLAACGNAALKTNAVIARAMLEAQTETGPVIREARVEAGVEAARIAMSDGLSRAIAHREAEAATDRWECAVSGHRLYSEGVSSYIDTLVLWNAGADFELTDVIPFAVRAVNSYRVMTTCLGGLGMELPEPAFLDLIPSDWADQPPPPPTETP